MRVLPLLLLTTTSCGLLAKDKIGTPTGEPRYWTFRDTGGTYCLNPVENSYGGQEAYVKYEVSVGSAKTLDDQIRSMMCQPLEEIADWRDMYADFDDARFDHYRAALMIMTCVGTGNCDSAEGAARARAWYSSHERDDFSYSATATLAWYAEQADHDQVAKAIAASTEPARVKELFLARFDASRQHILDTVATMDPRYRAVYVETAASVRARRAEDEVALAPFRARFAELKEVLDVAMVDGKVTAEHLASILALRDEVVAACRARSHTARYCLAGPVARPLAELAVRAAIVADEPALAIAEAAVLDFGPDQTELEYEIHEAVGQAMKEESERYYVYAHARDQGIDDEVLDAKFGDPPPLDLYSYVNAAGLAPPDGPSFSSELYGLDPDGTRTERVQREVRKVKKGKNGRATITFKDIVSSTEYPTGCHETNKINRIDESGYVEYEEVCTGPWVTSTHRDRAEPIEVSFAEADAIQTGETVLAIVDAKTRKGYVVRVFASAEAKEPVQLRAFRTGP